MLRRLNFRFALIGLLLAAGLVLAPAQSQTLGNAIAVDASGGVYTGGADAASISKTDGWQIHLGHNRSDAVRALMAAPDGSLYAAGTVEQSGFVAHISAAGERIGWLDLDKAASALAMDGDGAVYASGTGFIEKLDANLNLIARIDLSGTAAAIAVRQDGAIFAGDDSRLVTYSSKGDVLNTFDFGAGTIINGVALDASGAIFVTGSTSSLNLPAARNSMTGPQDAYVAKIGSSGTVEWSVYVGGSGIDAAAAIALRPDGSLVIAGYTNSSDFPRTATGDRWHGGEDGFTAELDAQGNITASSYFGTSGNDRLQALAIDKHGTVHVAGTSDQLWKGLDPRTPPPCSAATLGVTSLLEGPAAGSDSSIVLCSGTWNSSTGTSWIHTSSSGTGNGLMTFTFDSNGGGTRSGSITVSNATLNITQAPTGYVGAGPVQVSTDITAAQNIAVDSSGNVYIADDGPDYPGNDGFITKWTVSNGQASTLITSGGFPYGIAIDGSSNVYISDSTNTNVKEWTYPNGPLSANLVSGLSFPQSVALGSSGLYIADTVNDAIKLWVPPSGPVSTVCQMAYAFDPYGVVVDLLGNVYFTNYFGFYQVTGSSSYSTLSTAVKGPNQLAVDGGGNVYIADSDHDAVKKWSASAQQLTTVASTGTYTDGVAIDRSGNIYFATSTLQQVPAAQVPGGPIGVGSGSGSGSLGAVVPSSQNLSGIYAPSSDSSWLHILSVSNGVVSYSYDQNQSSARTGHITLLGVPIAVNQAGVTLVPTTLNIVAGNNQSKFVSQAYGTNLEVQVLDQFGNNFSGASVTFAIHAGGGGASGTFPSSSTTQTVTTNSSGDATASVLTANGNYGGFTVTVTVAGTGLSQTFNLTNTAYDLTIGKAPVGSFYLGQQNAQYTITVTNAGNLATNGTITVTDTLPTGFSYVSGSSGWTCGVASQVVTCTNSGPVSANNGTLTLRLTTNISTSAGTSATNAASVACACSPAEPNTSNNSVSIQTPVALLPDLTVAASHSPSTFTVNDSGDGIVISVSNSGVGPTSGTVTVTDTLPAGLTFVNLNTPSWSCSANGQAVTCSSTTTIGVNQVANTLVLVVSVASSTSSPLTNNVSVACTCSESNTGNNTNTDMIPVIQTVPITLQTSPAGLQVSGDGGTTFYAAPHTFFWIPNSQQTIVTTSPQSGGTGIQYSWLSWNDSGAISHTITVPTIATTYTASFATYYLLTTAVNPAAGGTISPATLYVPPGNQLAISASANSGYQFVGFSGALSGAANPQNLTANAPATVTANFALITQTSLTAQPSPSIFGAGVTLTATVTSSSTPTSGAVTFYDGTSVLGIAAVNSNGVASLSTILLGDGARSLTARYEGGSGSTWAPSPSAAVSQTVNAQVADGFLQALGSPVAVGNMPEQIAVGDFNGDGIADVAVVNYGDGTISILLGNGSGGFTASPLVSVSGAYALAVGDFNGDGNADLAVTQYSGSVSILLGDGHGNFTVHGSFATALGSLSVAIGDFNGDGNADLAVVNGNANSVTILLGDGTGNFTATANPVTTGRDPYIVAVGDFNGDGKPDLAVANELDNTVSIFLGDGAGGFTQSGNAIPVGSSPQGLAVGDFNGDGKLDLATSNVESNNVTILIGNGDGTFTPTGVSPATGIKPTSIATGDFNGDGKLDLAVANYGSSNNVTILLGDGTGAFTAESVSPSVLFNATDIVVSDFNGDGRADLAVVNSANSNVTILLGVDTPTQITASPTTGQSATVGTAFGTPLSVTLLDAFNNPVQGVQVTFTAPTGSGIASGTFASSPSVTTNSQGVATAPAFTANAVTGGPYMVTATAGTLSTSFSLTNNPEAAPTFAASFLTNPIAVNTTSQLQFTITNPSGNAVPLSSVAFSDTLPSGLTIGNGTSSHCGGTLTLTSPSNITLSGAAVAVGVPCVFTVTVTGATQGSYSTTTSAVTAANASTGGTATAPLTVNGADLTIAKSHMGNFTQGDTGDTYTITVKNIGSGPTDGSTVTVTDTVPAGLTPTGPTGMVNGWYCGIAMQMVTCTRMEVLLSNSSYPPLPVTVNVASNALSSLTNMAAVAGGGDITPSNNTASDPTTIIQVVNVTVGSNIGGPTVTVDNGTPFTGSQMFTWVVGSNHTIAASTPQSGGAGIQYVWLGWSDSGTSSHSVTTPSTATTYTANFQTQYLLTTAVNPSAGGTISPGTEYVNPGTQASVSATANSGYQFLGFSGALSGTTNPQTVTVNAPAAVTANFGLITQTSLMAAPNPSIFGAGVILTATVTSSSTPTSGKVTFYDGTSVLGVAPVNASGVATLSTILLGDGARSLTARYEGGSGSTWAPSLSAAVNQTVNAQQADGFLQPAGSPIAVGNGPAAVARGDFNGDGIADLAIANGADNTVQILLGNGAGGFTAGSPIAVGSDPVAIAVGDFNGDGKPDLAVANYNDNTLTILLGDGAGGFAVTGSPIGVGDNPDALVVADFNGDGVADLAVGNRANGTVTVLLGDGSGAFSQSVLNPVGGFPVSLTAGDFNGDGKTDIALADEGANLVTILLGDGTGRLEVAGHVAVGTDPKSIVVGDFNGDGKLDLATANNGSNNVTILLGNGMGGFAAASVSPAAGMQPQAISAGDFNGDGKLDLAVANNGGNNVTILIGDGMGAFTAESVSPATGNSPIAIAVGDFNGDGKADLAVANNTGKNVTILLGVDTPTQINTNANTTPQSATVGTAFGTSLSVTLLDAFNNPVPNVQVTFTAPSSGIASGTFASSSIVTTNSQGVATAPTFTANGVAGGPYNVTATAGTLSTTFSLTNNPETSPTFAASFLTSPIAVNTTSQLQFTITNPSGNAVPVTGVTFSDVLPAGLTVTTGTSSPCGGTLTLTGPSNITLSGATVAVGTPCVFTVTVTGASAGAYSITTSAIGTSNASTGGSATASLTVAAPPSISAAFGASPSIPLTGITSLTFTINNPANNITLHGLAFSATLSSGLVAGGTVTNTGCGGTASLANSGLTVQLSGGSLATNTSCTISVTVSGTTAGAKSASAQINSTEGGLGNTATANILVVAPPTVTIGFSPSAIALNANSTLSFTITNPNTGSSLSNVGFTYSLPTGVVVAASPNIMGTCGSATPTATALGASIGLSGGTLAASPAAGSSCTFSVSVTGTTAGSKSTSLIIVTSTEGGTGGPSNTATLTVVAPPSISASFVTSPINVNQTSTLTFTIANPSANTVALTGVGCSDTLNSGLTLVSSMTSVCNGGTLTLTSPTGIVLSGVTIPVSGQCQVSVVVTGVTANTYTNTTSGVTSTNGATGNTATASLTVNGADLTIAKSHTGNFTQGDTGDTYTITVSNVGSGPTDGSNVTVSDTLPAGLTPTGPTGSVSGWNCGIASQTVTCTRNDVLAINNAYPSITVTVNVAANAAPLVTNTATVAGGADINLNNNSASNPTTIIQVVKITVGSNLSGPTVTVDNGTPFTGSQTYTWVVSSSHTIATSTPQSGGTGIQYAWQNWSDSGALSHSVTTPSTATTYTANFQTQYLLTTAVSPSGEGTISPSTEYVNANSMVPVSATANPTYVFTGFSGGLTGTTNPQNLTMSGPMTVTANFETGPNPTIAEMYNSNFRQGDAGDTYTVTVTNVGQAPTAGMLQWADTLPTGLTAIGLSGPAGWTCTLGTLTCSTSNALAGGANAVFTLIVNVAANAAPSVTNVVTVSGGGDVILTNNTASLPTPVIQVADLTVTKTHSGSFVEGQTGTYTITVNNIGPGPTVGTVTVTDTLPAGLQALSMSGSGWTCNTSTVSCTRSSALASNASSPAITLTVLVGSAAPSVTNVATVAGGGELNTSNDTATDPTTIIQTVQVTVTTSPANLIVTVDGTSVTGPHTYTWDVGQQHTIATSTPQTSLNFQNWSDGGAISHNITVSQGTTTYTATFH